MGNKKEGDKNIGYKLGCFEVVVKVVKLIPHTNLIHQACSNQVSAPTNGDHVYKTFPMLRLVNILINICCSYLSREVNISGRK